MSWRRYEGDQLLLVKPFQVPLLDIVWSKQSFKAPKYHGAAMNYMSLVSKLVSSKY